MVGRLGREKGKEAANETYVITWVTSWNFISWRSSEKQRKTQVSKLSHRGVRELRYLYLNSFQLW